VRPTVDEQLSGTCRLLDEVVAPAVADPYAAEILRGLVSNLRMLTGALPQIPQFLAWDNTGTVGLLDQMKERVALPLAQEIARELAPAGPDPLDLNALNDRNERLRALLSRALLSEELTPEDHRAARAHLAQRAARSPIRFAVPVPAATRG
jgi:hypothetical protein